MNPHLKYMVDLRNACLAERPTQKPAAWCVENLVFDEAGNHGPFRTAGCEYIVEVLNDFADANVTDEVLVWGSQSRKTGSLMGGVCWCVENDPSGFLWVMPSSTLAGKFSRQRLQKLMKASPAIAKHIPTQGMKRHDFATASMMLGASTINLVGSNSPGNLSSNPCRRVIQDEVDKFNEGTDGEADAVNLADQRTKDAVNPQRWKTSTPTMVTGLIWQEYLKGNQKRYFMPCPLCSSLHRREIVLAWSPSYSVLPKTGSEAYVKWDKEAKRKDGKWDLERVEKSARYVCPHCHGDIQDNKKTWMVRDGVWRATNTNSAVGFVSRHLSSLYVNSQQTTVGAIAKKFLQAFNSLQGLRGFINGELAEPYEMQEKAGRRTERIVMTSERTTVEVADPWTLLLTVDCQRLAPHFWAVARAWAKGRCEGVWAGSLDTWEDIRAKQKGLNIQDGAVCVDSAFGARSEADVYKNCARFGTFRELANGRQLALGWMPVKGMPVKRKWKDDESGLMVPYYLSAQDPFGGTAEAGKVEMTVLEFSSDFYKDILEAMREGKGNFKWSVLNEMASPEYWRHMDGEFKAPLFNKRTGKTEYVYQRRSQHWPNHLYDCENIQIAAANFFRLVDVETVMEPESPNDMDGMLKIRNDALKAGGK